MGGYDLNTMTMVTAESNPLLLSRGLDCGSVIAPLGRTTYG